MKKKLSILMLLAALIVPWASIAQTRVATAGNWSGTTSSAYGGFHNTTKYSWTQTLYTQSEMGGAGWVQAIILDNRSTATNLCDSVKIYLGHTTMTSHPTAAVSTWVPMADLSLVWSRDNYTIPGEEGQLVIELDQPFYYNGTGSLALVVSKAAQATSSNTKFGYTSTTAIMKYTGGTTESYCRFPTVAGTNSTYKENIMFVITTNQNDNYCLPLQGLHAVAATTSSATFAWNGETGASYEVGYAEVGGTENSSTITPSVTSDTSYTFSSLDLNTSYWMYVRKQCANNAYSAWDSVMMRTLMTPLTLPLSFDFEDSGDDADWAISNSSNGWYFGSVAGRRAMFISNDNGTSNAYTITNSGYSWAWVDVSLTDTGIYAVGFDWRANGEGNWDFLRVALVPSSVMFSSVYGDNPTGNVFRQSVPAGWINLSTTAAGDYKLNLSSEWEHFGTEVHITDSMLGDYHLAIIWVNDASGGTQPPAAIDNISMQLATCFAPMAYTLSDTLSHSITLNVSHPDATTFMAVYQRVGTTRWDTVDISDSYTFTDLEMGRQYTGFVYTLCGSDTSIAGLPFTFTTACGALTADDLPYFEDFEAYGTGTGNPINPCWHKGVVALTGSGTTTTFPYPYSTAAINGTRGLYFYAATTSTTSYYNWMVLPPIDNTELLMSDLMVTFKLKRTATSTHKTTLVVGVTTDYSSTAGFVPVDTIDLSSAAVSTVHDVEVSFANYTGTGTYVLFYAPAPTMTGSTAVYNAFYIDDIALRAIPTCFWPTAVALESIASDEATLRWTPDARTTNPDGWNIEYGPAGFTRGNGTLETATDTTITLIDLLPNTEYDVYVSANCGSEESDPTFFSFHTECVDLDTLPYTQDFEQAAVGSGTSTTFVECMHRLNNGTTNFGHPYVSSTASYNHTVGGGKGLYWTNTTTATTYGDYQCIVLPAADPVLYPINTLQVRFWAKATSTSYNVQLQVGVMTNPNDISTFQLVENVAVGGNTTYTEYTVAFGTYTGQGRYVAIKAVRPTAAWYASIDDITLELMPPCPAITDIEATTTVGGALLNWSWDAGYMAPENYEITYDSIGGTNPTTLNATTNSITLTGLEANTTYKAYVRADCDDDGYGLVDSVTFTTGQFGCAQFDPTTLDTISVGNGTVTEYYVPVSNYFKCSYTQQLILASEINVNGAAMLTGIDFEYSYATPTTAKSDVTLYLVNTTATSLSSAFVTYNQNTFKEVYHGNFNCAQGWNHFEFDTPFAYDGTSNLLIVALDNSNAFNGSAYVYKAHAATGMARYRQSDSEGPYDIATVTGGSSYDNRCNMKLYAGDCQAMAICAAPSVVISDVAATSVDLEWAPGYNESSWNVDYRVSGSTTWINAATGVATNSYTVTGLQDATEYIFRVSFYCTGDDTIYAGTATATTLCMPKPLPYSENFDNITTSTTAINSGVMPLCWDYTMTGSSTYQAASYHPGVYYGAAYAASGNYSLRLYGVGVVELPEMSAPLDSLRIMFSDTTTAASYGLQLGVMENGIFVPLQTLTLATGVRNYFEIPLRNYHGTSRTLAFRNTNTTSTTYYSYHYIDDIVVDYIPVCLHVEDLAVDSVTTNSITVSWNPVGIETSWYVVCDTLSMVVTDSTATFTGLTPNTSYTIDVHSICGVGDTSEAASLVVRTSCAAITTMPFFADFEDVSGITATSPTTNNLPSCWSYFNHGTRASYMCCPYVYSSSTYAHSGNNSIRFYTYNSSADSNQYLILPLIDSTAYPLNTLQVSFWLRGNSATTNYHNDVVVGVMTDPSVESSFVPCTTITSTTTTYTYFECNLDNYTGYHGRIALKFPKPATSSQYEYGYVDDITVDRIPLCPRVENIEATVMLTSATVSWTDTSSNTAWNVEYDTVTFTPGTGHMTPIHVTDTFAVLTGLDSGTVYHVYVYPDCNNDVYSIHSTFTTRAASPASVPYSCNFEAAGVNGWELINGAQTNQWMVGNAVSNGGNRSLYITNDDSANAYTITTASYVFATRTINIADTGDYVCSFEWKATGEACCDFIRAALVPDSTVLTAGDYSGFDATTAMPAGGIALDGGNRLNQQSTWQNQVSELHISTPGIYKMVFLWRNDGSAGTQPPAAIDNVAFTLNTCPSVQNVAAVLTGSSIDLTWTAGGSETSWQVMVGTNSAVVNTPSYTANGLTANTDYTVRIRPICGVGDTGFAHVEVFHTPCAAVNLPFNENFDSYTTSTTAATGVQVDCWNYVMTGTSTYQTSTYQPQVYYSSSYAQSGSYSLRLYGVSYTMLPPMPANLDELELTFSDYCTSASYLLEVGVMEGNTFVPIQTINSPTSSHTDHSVYFANYTGNSRIIAFRNYNSSATSYTSIHYIDNVSVDYLPTCPPVIDIVATQTGTTELIVDWTDVATTTQKWLVRYGVSGSSNTTTIIANSHPVTITGLDTLTSYAFTVRPICSAGDTGNWSQSTILSTEMCDGAVVASTGNATSTTYSIPVNNLYKYTLSEVIIDSAELVGIGDISAIAYDYAYATAMTKKTDVTIWLQPTNKSTFSSSSDVVALNPATAVQVYHGDLNCSQGWNYYTLDTTYTWDGHSNLLVIVDDNSNQYNSSTYTFRSSSCSGSKSLAYYSDSQNPDPATVTSSYSGTKTVYTYRPTMKLVSCGGGCLVPFHLTFDTTYNTVTLNWQGSDSAEVGIHEGLWDETTATTAVSTTGTYTFTGLTPNTDYTVAVRSLCGDGVTSAWATLSVTTPDLPCFAPENVTVSNIGVNSAKVSWTPVGNESEWIVKVYRGTVETHYDTVINNHYCNVSGLYSATTYSVTVMAVCGDGVESEWSDDTTFTTTECVAPSNVNATVSGRNAVVTWNATGADEYHVLWFEAGFTIDGDSVIVTNGTTNATITGLEGGQDYDIYVYAYCDGHRSTQAGQTTIHVTGIDDANGSLINLYPNPASTTVTIDGIVSEVLVTIVDMNGRTVYSEKTVSNLTIDLAGMAKGAYFVRITGENTSAIRKLIVK